MHESTARIADQVKSRIAFCVPAWCDFIPWADWKNKFRTWSCCFCSWSWHKTLVGFHQRFSRAPQKMEHKGTDPAYALAFKLDHSMFVVCWWPRSLLICWMCSSSSDYIQTPVCRLWMFVVVCGDLYYIIYVLWYLCISFYMRLDCIDHRYQISFIQVSVMMVRNCSIRTNTWVCWLYHYRRMKPGQPEGDARSGCVVFLSKSIGVNIACAPLHFKRQLKFHKIAMNVVELASWQLFVQKMNQLPRPIWKLWTLELTLQLPQSMGAGCDVPFPFDTSICPDCLKDLLYKRLHQQQKLGNFLNIILGPSARQAFKWISGCTIPKWPTRLGSPVRYLLNC